MKRLTTAGLLIVLFAIAGCGGSSGSSSATSSAPAQATTTPSTPASTPAPAPTGGTVKLTADPSGALKFSTTSLTAKTGKVTIDFTNSAPLAHNVTIASSSGAVVGATPTFQGGTKSLTLNLTPGTYKFYCSVPGHRQAGMQGTLVVR